MLGSLDCLVFFHLNPNIQAESTLSHISKMTIRKHILILKKLNICCRWYWVSHTHRADHIYIFLNYMYRHFPHKLGYFHRCRLLNYKDQKPRNKEDDFRMYSSRLCKHPLYLSYNRCRNTNPILLMWMMRTVIKKWSIIFFYFRNFPCPNINQHKDTKTNNEMSSLPIKFSSVSLYLFSDDSFGIFKKDWIPLVTTSERA